MANANFYLCDVCGNRVPQEQRLHIPVGRCIDGAGSPDTEYEVIDLCAKHLHKVLEHIVKEQKQAYEDNQKLVAYIKTLKS